MVISQTMNIKKLQDEVKELREDSKVKEKWLFLLMGERHDTKRPSFLQETEVRDRADV